MAPGPNRFGAGSRLVRAYCVLNNSFTLAQRWTVVTGPPGHWPDADMLPLGRLGPRCPVDGANRTTAFTHNEQVMMLSLWAIMPSPLMLGANLVASNDPFLTALLTNEEVLAVNQDVLGARGTRVALSGDTEVWAKDLSGGRKAVGLFNRGATDATVTALYAPLAVTGTQVVRDLWRRAAWPPAPPVSVSPCPAAPVCCSRCRRCRDPQAPVARRVAAATPARGRAVPACPLPGLLQAVDAPSAAKAARHCSAWRWWWRACSLPAACGEIALESAPEVAMRLGVTLIVLAVIGGAVACDASAGRTTNVPTCRDPLLPPVDDAGTDADVDAGSADGGAGRSCRRSEPVFVCAVPNARDLVGTPVANGQSVACGAIYRGPPLAALTSEGCQVFATLGIKTVIDLRTVEERASRPESACVAAGAAVVSAPMPVPYSVSPTDYIADMDASASVAAAFAVLGDPAAYPVYMHCTYGRDRTGVLSALVLSALGASRADILHEYGLSQASVGAFPASLSAMLDEIDRRGGIDVVLAAAGVTPEQLAMLRTRAVAVAP